jgi:hypothetical protein
MKYLCLVYAEQKDLRTMTDDECMEYDEMLRGTGHCIASEALQPVETARTVRVRNEKTWITDGPFAETKEQLAGFYLIDAPTMDDAVRLAAGIPPARAGSIEVRPIRELQSSSGKRREL